jgi:hypothetical protein
MRDINRVIEFPRNRLLLNIDDDDDDNEDEDEEES